MNFDKDVLQVLTKSGVRDVLQYTKITDELEKIDSKLVLLDDVTQAPSLEILYDAEISSAIIKDVERNLHKMGKTLVVRRKKPLPFDALSLDPESLFKGLHDDAQDTIAPYLSHLSQHDKENVLMTLKHSQDCRKMRYEIMKLQNRLKTESLSAEAIKQLQFEIKERETNLELEKAAGPKNISDLNDDELALVVEQIPMEFDRIQFARAIGHDDIDPAMDRKMFMRKMRDVRTSPSEKFKTFLHFVQHVSPTLKSYWVKGEQAGRSKLSRLKIAQSYDELHDIMLQPVSGALLGTPQQQMLNFMQLFAALGFKCSPEEGSYFGRGPYTSSTDISYSSHLEGISFQYKKSSFLPYNDPAYSGDLTLEAEYMCKLDITKTGKLIFIFNVDYSRDLRRHEWMFGPPLGQEGRQGGGRRREPLPPSRTERIEFQVCNADAETFEAGVFSNIVDYLTNNWPGQTFIDGSFTTLKDAVFHRITKMLAEKIDARNWKTSMPASTISETFVNQITQFIIDSKLIFTEEYRPMGGGGMIHTEACCLHHF